MHRLQRVSLFAGLIFVLGMPPSRAAQLTPNQTSTQADEPVVVETCGHNGQISTTEWSELHRQITVCIKGLNNWARTPGHDPRNLRLFLAGHMLPKLDFASISESQEYVNFVLRPDSSDKEDRKRWVQILDESRRATVPNEIPLSVGVEKNREPFDSEEYITLNVYPHYTYAVILLLIAILAILIWTALTSDLLRETSIGTSTPGQRSPYSLGRVQMAFWFYIAVASYLFIWLITGETSTLTTSVLALIGISAGTGLTAVLIDQGKISSLSSQRAALNTQREALTARIREIEQNMPPIDSPLYSELQEKKSRLAEINASINNLPGLPSARVSKGFLRDLLEDGDGVSFHRFQIVIWTVVMGIVFVEGVHQDLTMPDFDATLLGLMGLSSGTYLGFKFPEKPKLSS